MLLDSIFGVVFFLLAPIGFAMIQVGDGKALSLANAEAIEPDHGAS
jgi:hypothetical protein